MKVDTCNYVHFVLANVNNRLLLPVTKTSQMFSNELTPKQASDLHKEIYRIATYLNRLADRMAQLQFAPDDRLFQLVQAAEKSFVLLSNETYAVRTRLQPRASKRSMGG